MIGFVKEVDEEAPCLVVEDGDEEVGGEVDVGPLGVEVVQTLEND